MNKKSNFYISEKRLIFISLAILLISACFIIVSISLKNQETIYYEDNARVQTIWGCLPVAQTVSEFSRVQGFTESLFGYRLQECR